MRCKSNCVLKITRRGYKNPYVSLVIGLPICTLKMFDLWSSQGAQGSFPATAETTDRRKSSDFRINY
jgi:hypothetical protein